MEAEVDAEVEADIQDNQVKNHMVLALLLADQLDMVYSFAEGIVVAEGTVVAEGNPAAELQDREVGW